ncbi:hypothetical protein SDRG_06065 [Saprolegnia diclina VS20]|uniref:t-SNARE coiled-coil homology domain-containing protein n=1 Tax=Saprolegnia diclina (strain VS20) TaxID=1156394 RepID=T0QRP5_SAPDV|nr:hypothetical protein SDRG_06065 [Saprolegnia diclina VS20]EQC36625.1 hypothetical protein SDRG_06065 [Saprolegnia diclina VS20]|eukprot:XP_008610046.1 hypothetical protein SDRG_06065 [Saprolegnia diclina VS20]
MAKTSSAAAWSAWMDRLENARASQQSLSSMVRTSAATNLGTSVFALQQSAAKLRRDFDAMTAVPTSNAVATPQEIRRREDLLKTLEGQTSALLTTYNSRAQGTRGASTVEAGSQMLRIQNQMMQDQDDQLAIIGSGVANLKHFSFAIKDETDLHHRLLDDMNQDIDRATLGLESEGDRAELVAKRSSNFRLYLAILVLSAILVFELVIGGSK